MKVVVIGGGVAGLSIGWRLRQAGAEVTVLERAQVARGATWASAGMIAATAEIEEGDSPAAQMARRSAILWPQFAQEIEEVSASAISFLVNGTLTVARTVEKATALHKRAKASAQLEFLLPEAARSLEPLLSQETTGALLDRAEAQVDNRALGLALAVAFQCAGGILHINEPVVRFEIANSRAAAVRTPFASYAADAFILAAGAWSSRIEGLPPEAVPPIIPVKGEMIALARQGALLPKHMIWGNDVYLVPRGCRLLVGATVTHEGFDTRITRAAAAWLREHATALLPTLVEWTLVENWAGLRPGSPDDLPLIGPSFLDGLFIASGQFRNGILFAPAIAEAVRDMVLTNEFSEPYRAFDPRRFGDNQRTP